jgi:hypothetical protein
MRVVLKRPFFGPDGSLIRHHPGGLPVDMPGSFKKYLPKDARVVPDDEVIVAKTLEEQRLLKPFVAPPELGLDREPPPANPLHVLDGERAAADHLEERARRLAVPNEYTDAAERKRAEAAAATAAALLAESDEASRDTKFKSRK